jgi:hypothetical protein
MNIEVEMIDSDKEDEEIGNGVSEYHKSSSKIFEEDFTQNLLKVK